MVLVFRNQLMKFNIRNKKLIKLRNSKLQKASQLAIYTHQLTHGRQSSWIWVWSVQDLNMSLQISSSAPWPHGHAASWRVGSQWAKKKHTFTKLGVDTGIAEVSDWKFCEKYRAAVPIYEVHVFIISLSILFLFCSNLKMNGRKLAIPTTKESTQFTNCKTNQRRCIIKNLRCCGTGLWGWGTERKPLTFPLAQNKEKPFVVYSPCFSQHGLT